MKKLVLIFLVVCICSFLSTGQILKRKKQRVLPPLTAQEINAESLWKRITVEEDYEKYPFWSDHKGLQPGQSPHGLYHKIYIHPYIESALPVQQGQLPDGSIVVKVNMDVNENITAYTIMAKVKGYNPDAHDWFWAKLDAQGNETASGKVAPCIECHSALASNDYIIVHRINKK